MFGSAKRLRERLERSGRRAPAVVVHAEPTTQTLGYPGGLSTDRKWKLTITVRPAGEPEFDVDVKDYFPVTSPPNEGSTMDVWFDADDHTRVCVDIASAVAVAAPPSTVDASDLSATAAELKTWSVSDPPSMRKQWQMRDQLRAFQMAQARGGKGTIIVTGAAAGVLGGPEGSTDAVEQLSRLADLKERGALTEAEFEAAKKRLLGQ